MAAQIAVIHEVLSWISKSKRLYQFSHKSLQLLAITKAKDQIRPELKRLDPEITLELTDIRFQNDYSTLALRASGNKT